MVPVNVITNKNACLNYHILLYNVQVININAYLDILKNSVYYIIKYITYTQFILNITYIII